MSSPSVHGVPLRKLWSALPASWSYRPAFSELAILMEDQKMSWRTLVGQIKAGRIHGYSWDSFMKGMDSDLKRYAKTLKPAPRPSLASASAPVVGSSSHLYMVTARREAASLARNYGIAYIATYTKGGMRFYAVATSDKFPKNTDGWTLRSLRDYGD